MSRPAYWCLLDEQPHYLVPRHAIEAQRLDDLVLHPDCRFSWQGGAALACPDEADAFLPAACVAWAPDPATGIRWPYWVGYELIEPLAALSAGRTRASALCPEHRWILAQAGVLVGADAPRRGRAEDARHRAWLRAQFEAGFVPMRALVPSFHLGALRRYYRQRVRQGALRLGDGQVDRRYVAHNEPVARFLQRQLERSVAAVVGRALKPSYAYLAAYQGGAMLERHTDRPQCEYTLSLCVDFTPELDGACPWSINLDLDRRTLRVHQREGDGLLFRGRRIPHHRDRLPSRASATNVLLHYVDADFAGTLE